MAKMVTSGLLNSFNVFVLTFFVLLYGESEYNGKKSLPLAQLLF